MRISDWSSDVCSSDLAELGLGDPALSEAQLLDAMMAHPILINRPIVVSPKGVRLCRPSEDVLDLLPPQRGAFVKEDGERVIDEHGQRVATARSEEHTSELQSLMRISYAVFCLQKKNCNNS